MTSQTPEEKAYSRGYKQGKFDAEMDRLNITPDSREVEEVVEEIGNLLQTGEYDKAVAYLHQELQKAREKERNRINKKLVSFWREETIEGRTGRGSKSVTAVIRNNLLIEIQQALKDLDHSELDQDKK